MHARKLWCFVLASALALVLTVQGPFVATATSPSGSDSMPELTLEAPSSAPPIVGVNYHGLWWDMTPSRRAAVLDKLAATGTTWVRLDVSWAMLQPDGPHLFDHGYGVPRIEQVLDEIDARGMSTLMMLYWPPKWSSGTDKKNGVPRDAQEFANAAAWVADEWRDKVQAIEVWNEPDLDRFLSNTSVTTYTALVKATYRSVKAVNRDMIVVAGAPTYVNVDWYREFYKRGGADHYDALGVHPYVGMADAAPHACDPHNKKYYPCHIDELVSLMRQYGDGDKKIWATEYGWSAHDNSTYGRSPDPWKRGVTRAQQAEYLLGMQEYLAKWPQVEASFWYTDVDTAVGDAQEDNYGLLDRNLNPKPAYHALRCAAQGCGETDSSVERVAGADRYATAALLSRDLKPGQRVFVASGRDYPDALAAAAKAGARHEAVLLTRTESLPSATSDVLRRLRPTEIIVVGGEEAVSPAVLDALTGLAPVKRIARTDRYATAAAVSELQPATTGGTAYIATGTEFPDALAAAARAGREESPILLVRPDEIPDETVNALRRLRPARIVIVGGTGSVSENVAARLAQLTPRVQRIAGVDRYQTAALLAGSDAPVLHVSSGQDFADALAAAPAAAAVNGAVLLTAPDRVSGATSKVVSSQDPDKLIVTGGPGAVSETVRLALIRLTN